MAASLRVPFITALFAFVASAQSVPSFAGNAQHTANYSPAAQDLNRIRWSTTIDLNNTVAFTHYGAPLITAANTVIVPVKTASNGFEVNSFNGATGAAQFTLSTDYALPSCNWIPVYEPAIATGAFGTRLYYAGFGGTVYYIDNPDSSTPDAPVQIAFYGLASYQANESGFGSTVFINTPLTADASGDVFFGFRVQGTAPSPLGTSQSGFARIAPNGAATYVLAESAASDSSIAWDSHNSAPALSNDGSTLYVVVKSATANSAYGYLLGLDSTTLATKYKVFLSDPRNGSGAYILDDSTASPTVGPDGDVYMGVFGNPDNGSRGFLLRFSGDLATEKTPGAFGWDYTPGIVPASMVPSYTGSSAYLIFAKYNNYANAGDGDGVNRVALLDPNQTQIDPHPSASGLVEMREVMTAIGVTPDPENLSTTYPYAVREWCINTPAINPATNSIFTPSEDGHIYRWNLSTNSLAQVVTLGAGVGEPYISTIIGPDGTVYTLNGGSMFALGSLSGVSVRLTSSAPDIDAVVAGTSLTFTAAVAKTGAGATPTGTVTFQDTSFNGVTPATVTLASGVALDANGHASVATSTLTAGTHFIAAAYSGDGNYAAGGMTLVERIHSGASAVTINSSPTPPVAGQAVTLTATVGAVAPATGVPTGELTFLDNGAAASQVPLSSGAASLAQPSYVPGAAITAAYPSDTLFASSTGQWTPATSNITMSVAPDQGLGTKQVFTAQYTDTGSVTDLSYVSLVIGPAGTTHTCNALYYPATNQFFLYSDTGTALGPLAPGSGGSESNGQCQLDGRGSAASTSGNTLTVSFPIAFRPAYSGMMNLYLDATRAGGPSTGYVAGGTWDPESLFAGPVTPSAGSGLSQIFSAQYGYANGVADLSLTALIVGPNNSVGHNCYVEYLPPSNQLYLYNDNGNIKLGPIAPGSAATLANSQCTVNGTGSSAATSGDILTLALALTFKPGYTGPKTIFVLAKPQTGGDTNYVKAGTWTP